MGILVGLPSPKCFTRFFRCFIYKCMNSAVNPLTNQEIHSHYISYAGSQNQHHDAFLFCVNVFNVNLNNVHWSIIGDNSDLIILVAFSFLFLQLGSLHTRVALSMYHQTGITCIIMSVLTAIRVTNFLAPNATLPADSNLIGLHDSSL